MRSVRPFQALLLSLCVLVLVSLALFGCGGGDEPNITTPTIADVSTNATFTSISIPELPDLPQVQVPDVVGMVLSDASAAVHAVGLGTAGVHFPVLDYDGPTTIIEQDPAAGTWVPVFTTVVLTFNSPGDYMIDVVGMPEYDACWLVGGGAGGPWHVTCVYATTPASDYWGVVMAQTPAPGVLWGLEPPVTLVVGEALESVTTASVIPSLTTTPTVRPKRTLPSTTTTSLFIPFTTFPSIPPILPPPPVS